MADEILSGDTQAPDAGGQDLEAQEPTGGTEPADAGQVGDQGDDEEPQLSPEQELAFKKRLEREQRKLEERIRAEYEQRYVQRQPDTTTSTVTPDAVTALADRLGISVEAAQVMIAQQLALNEMRENVTKAEAKAEVQALRAEKPWLPEWDDARLQEIRADYKRRYGADLPWREAYQRLVAEAALSGSLVTAAEQRAIKNIASRQSATVQQGKGQKAQPPDIWSLPKDEFEKLVARAKAGELKEL